MGRAVRTLYGAAHPEVGLAVATGPTIPLVATGGAAEAAEEETSWRR